MHVIGHQVPFQQFHSFLPAQPLFRRLLRNRTGFRTQFGDPALQSSHLALQQHNDGSVVEFRNAMVKRLPADETAAWAEGKEDMPDLPAAPVPAPAPAP